MGSTTDTGTEHRYQRCRDESCERFLCRVFKDGWRTGYGYGYDRGHAIGFAEGFGEGVASCPRDHA